MVEMAIHTNIKGITPVNKSIGAGKKIKLFVDAHCFDTEYQGTQTFLREIYQELIQYDDLEIYFGVYHTQRLKKIFPTLSSSHFLKYRSAGSLRRLLLDIPQLLKEHSFDFAHFQNISPIRLYGCKVILTLHDLVFNNKDLGYPAWYRFTRNVAFKKAIDLASIRTTVSGYSKMEISRQYGVNQNSIDVIPNATRIIGEQLQSREEARAYLYEKYGLGDFILNVSRIEPRKNQELLLDTFIELELYKEGMALVFIGKRSSASKNFFEKLKKYGGVYNIHWYEQVDQNDLATFYRAAKLFVYPSVAEGFGIPPLEAAACMAPVLCSIATAMSDYDFFQPNSFDPYEKDGLKRSMKAILKSPPAIDELEKIKSAVTSRYSWKDSANRLYRLIKQKAVQ